MTAKTPEVDVRISFRQRTIVSPLEFFAAVDCRCGKKYAFEGLVEELEAAGPSKCLNCSLEMNSVFDGIVQVAKLFHQSAQQSAELN